MRYQLLILLLANFYNVSHAFNESDKKLLVDNCIYETANTSKEEKIAVVHVVLNRIKDKRFPSSIEGVIMQPKQFSWTNNMEDLREPTEAEVKSCTKAVQEALVTEPHSYNHYFLASIKTPYWASDKELNIVDKHFFVEL